MSEAKSIKYSGRNDKKGVPICDNDLMKIFHFKSRSGRFFYMYKRALKIEENYYLVESRELGIRPLSSCHRVILENMYFGEMEVIDGDSFNHPFDHVAIHWSERKLKRNIYLFKDRQLLNLD